jgi:hypothetical protein
MIKEVLLLKSWQCGCFGCHAFGNLGGHLVAFFKENCGVYVTVVAFVIICTYVTMVGFFVSVVALMTEVLHYCSIISMFGIMCQLGDDTYVVLNEYKL